MVDESRDGRLLLGLVGETLASCFLRAYGYKILVRNYTCECGEIDLVAKDDQTLVFVEVKTRRSVSAGVPLESVTARKRRQISRAAAFYLKRFAVPDVPCRFDVVSVQIGRLGLPRIDLVRDAFPEQAA